jgi:hypothetical protein
MSKSFLLLFFKKEESSFFPLRGGLSPPRWAFPSAVGFPLRGAFFLERKKQRTFVR